MSGIYRHTPGKLSNFGVVDVGLKCPHSCKHCFYSFMDGSADQFAGMRHARWHKPENLAGLVRSLKEHRFRGFDVTGGEPTAYPGIVDLVALASSLGLHSRIITLGQFLTRKDLLARLWDAGLGEFRFSLHAVEAAMFAAMTGGELARLVAAMDACAARGFQVVTNTTVTEKNWRALPQIARWIAGRPEVYQATFLFFMPYYEWSAAHSGEHRVRYSDIAARLREAVAIVEAADIGVTIRYAPQCTIRGMERNHVGIAGVRHDPHEWMNAIDHKADPARVTEAQMWEMGRQLPLHDWDQGALLTGHAPLGMCASRSHKLFPMKCRSCAAINVCDGVDKAYLDQFGTGELHPYDRFRGDVLDRERLRYLPAFVCKASPLGDARAAVRQAFTDMEIARVAAA